MNPDDFRSPEAGRVIKNSSGYHAFIPAPLPPDIHYDPDLVLALSRADTALSELSGLGRLLPDPHCGSGRRIVAGESPYSQPGDRVPATKWTLGRNNRAVVGAGVSGGASNPGRVGTAHTHRKSMR
jgi:hypothetical protein